MKVGPLDPQHVSGTAGGERRAVAPAGSSPAEPSARVELSSRAMLRGDDSGRADFDAARVERVAQAIRDGSFRVDPEVIADKLIANAQELLGRPSA